LRVLLGITGGIAAYKAVGLIRRLQELGHDVTVVPTQNALHFIGNATLESLTGKNIDIDMYRDVADVRHVELGRVAELVIIAPATASFIARYAAGIADDLLLNALLATTAEVVIAPAMHTEMWNHESTQSNVKLLQSRGVRVMPPATGKLTSGDSGPGRMPEVADIIEFALSPKRASVTSASKPVGALAGSSVVITAGGTREPIDPVRFIGNSSSGRQGVALALAALEAGARVTLIAANLAAETLAPASAAGAVVRKVATSTELATALNSETSDVLLMAAAVSDYTVSARSQKLRRGEISSLELIATEDLVASYAKNHPDCLVVAFALDDSTELEVAARAKLVAKGAAMVIANRPAALNAESTEVLIVTSESTSAASGSKIDVAQRIIDAVSAMLSTRKARL
jgi:phosphopantothenoylcysteine decarboxylase / phosphopantothenate---cysteine ligase